MIPNTDSAFQLAKWFTAIKKDMRAARRRGSIASADAFLDEAEEVVDLILAKMPHDLVGDFNHRYRLRQEQQMR